MSRIAHSPIRHNSSSINEKPVLLPNTNTHNNYNNNNPHRVLKEPPLSIKSSIPLLPPATLTTVSTSSFTVNNNSSLMNNNNNNNINILQLKKRIKELETENEKLKNHVSHAEDAIQNYRGFLSVRNDNNNNNRKIDCSIQTDASFLSDNNQSMNMMNNITQSKIMTLEGLLKNSQQQCNDLRNENIRLKDKDNNNNEIIKNMQKDENELRSLLSSIKEEFSDQQAELKNVNYEKKMIITTQQENDKKNSLIMMMNEEIRNLKGHVLGLKQQSKLELEDFALHISQCTNEVVGRHNEAVKEMELKLKDATTTIKGYEGKVASLLDEVVSLQNTLSEKDEEIDLLKSTIEINQVLSKSCDQACDPLSPLANRSITNSKIDELETSNRNLQKDLLSQKDQLCKEDKLKEELQIKMKSISNSLYTLQENFSNQLDAVRHIAHVKDLVRVAGIREISLERDRVIGDLKHFKELCNILSFSLSTSEQALKESNPQVVEKLVEGRSKRILALEKINKERKRDIDQRSVETCAVSSTHLESFSVKAQTKYASVEEQTQNCINELAQSFKTFDITLPVYSTDNKKK